MLGLIKVLKARYSINMTYARCDNAGENEYFKRACKQEKMGFQYKYIAPGAPQQGGQVE